jgi:Zn-dependent protease/CBS domain-containing protein
MFSRSVRIFHLFGFEVKVDPSWLILAVLITWSLARGLFPTYYQGLSPAAYWWMGAAGTLGLFLAIVFHELSHSLVARRRGLPIKGITLFIFGGVAEMSDEPENPKTELVMAAAGPISSIILGLFFLLLRVAAKASEWPIPVLGVVTYLAFINFILAAFNLLPAFPLDGGRILRSLLWQRQGSLRRATRISSRIGTGFGAVLIVLGAVNFISGNFIGGVWWFLIGLFLRSAAQTSYRQVVIRKTLEGEKVERFMNRDPVTVPAEATVEKLVSDYIYRHHFKMYPVVEDGRLAGCVTTRQVKEVPREQWPRKRVGELTAACSRENSIGPDTDAVAALAVMTRTGNGRLVVVDNGRLAGIITLKDLLGFLSVKLDLEGGGSTGGSPVW